MGVLTWLFLSNLLTGVLITLPAHSVDTERGHEGGVERALVVGGRGLAQLFPLLLDSGCREWLRISGSGSGREGGEGPVSAGLNYGPREMVRYESERVNI